MKILKLFLIFILSLTLVLPVYAGQLDSYEAEEVEDVRAEFVPHNAVSVSTNIPIYPQSTEMPGHTLKQAGFQVENLIYKAPAKYKKVLKFYKKRLGKAAELNEVYEGRDHTKAHFFLQAGSQSRNIILEPLSDYETQITIITFMGGGGAFIDEGKME